MRITMLRAILVQGGVKKTGVFTIPSLARLKIRVRSLFDTLATVAGVFTIPGLTRLKIRVKPATKAGKKCLGSSLIVVGDVCKQNNTI